jgi:nicotinate-nucleotide adenylyltransferase
VRYNSGSCAVRIAIFGGTFDPIHSAHLDAARTALANFDLDRVLFVPAANPPHKAGAITAYAHRLRMVELACAGEPRFEASRLEEGAATSYSIDTIERVRTALGPGDHLYFLIGADAFADIATWHRWRDVVAAVTFLVVTRPGHDYAIPEGARVERLNTVIRPDSSSEIRAKLAVGASPKELPTAVLEYARANGLYCPAAAAPRGPDA